MKIKVSSLTASTSSNHKHTNSRVSVFFKLCHNVNLKIPKISFLAVKYHFWKFGIKVLMKAYFPVLFKVCKSLGAHSYFAD